MSRFPRGLTQPDKGFRFAADALLLSVFITPGPQDKVLDLGCGCGVVGLGLLLACASRELRVVGVDNDPEMIRCARINSTSLGLEQNTDYLLLDVTDISNQDLQPESFDLILMNPPYRRPGTGRPPSKNKRSAMVMDDLKTNAFFRAASFALKNRGRAGVIYPASRMDELLSFLNSHCLRPKRLVPVYGKPDKPARLVLVEARKNAGPEMTISPALIMYDLENRLTPQAGDFCPFLTCNSGREGLIRR